jgi:predicted phage tail protein
VIELFDGSVVSKLVVTITNTDQFADQFEVEYKESSETDYRLMRRGTNQIVEKYPVKEGAIYNIRARTINSLGVRSAFTSTNHEVVTAFIPPQDVTNYSIDVVGDKLHHTFDAVSDLDLDYYEIRFTSDTTETFYQNTTVLVPRIARPATSVVTPFVGAGKFLLKQ